MPLGSQGQPRPDREARSAGVHTSFYYFVHAVLLHTSFYYYVHALLLSRRLSIVSTRSSAKGNLDQIEKLVQQVYVLLLLCAHPCIISPDFHYDKSFVGRKTASVGAASGLPVATLAKSNLDQIEKLVQQVCIRPSTIVYTSFYHPIGFLLR